MTALDRRGAEITKGCYVIWVENRAGGHGTGLYTVLDVKNKILLSEEDWAGPRWVGARSVIVVESLPQVDGDRNTKKGTAAWRKKKLQ